MNAATGLSQVYQVPGIVAKGPRTEIVDADVKAEILRHPSPKSALSRHSHENVYLQVGLNVREIETYDLRIRVATAMA